MTVTLKNLKQYTPEYYDQMIPAIYLQTEDGLDWYYHRLKFQEETLKVCFDSENVIRMFDYNAQLLWPDGLSVTEVPCEKIPEGLDVRGNWYFIDGNIVPREQVENFSPKLIKEKQTRLIKNALQSVSLIQLKKMSSRTLTDAEESMLSEVLDYIVAVEAINPDDAPDIIWPQSV